MRSFYRGKQRWEGADAKNPPTDPEAERYKRIELEELGIDLNLLKRA